jgi:hypothetical protein
MIDLSHLFADYHDDFPENVIETASGRLVSFTNPDPDTISLDDIIHSLSGLPRFVNHTRMPYPVLPHLMLCVAIAKHLEYPLELQRHVIVHDFPEAYMGDCPAPLKRMLALFKVIEDLMAEACYAHFGLELPTESEHQAVKIVDLLALGVERIRLKDDTGYTWGFSPEYWKVCRELDRMLAPIEEIEALAPVFLRELLGNSPGFINSNYGAKHG